MSKKGAAGRRYTHEMRGIRVKKFNLQDGKCHYCGNLMVLKTTTDDRSRLCTLDHLIPLSKGGPDDWWNLVAACRPCNNKKGNKFGLQSSAFVIPHEGKGADT